MNSRIVVVFISLMLFLFTFMLMIVATGPLMLRIALRSAYGADAVQEQQLHFVSTRPQMIISNGDEWSREETRRWENFASTIELLLGAVLLAAEWYVINTLTNGMLSDGVKEIIANASKDQ